VNGLRWYVSYGSNLHAARLGCYLAGGRPPGGRVTNPGARDAAPPRVDRRVDLDDALLFGGPSSNWHGGPAYLDTDTPGHTIARAWLLTHEQFEDVVAQENRIPPGALTVPDELVHDGGVLLPDARYGRVVALPPIDDVPAVTFTYVDRPPPRAPDPRYLDLLHAGLRELGLGAEQAMAHLRTQPQLVDVPDVSP
jgi:hypothetical protein